MSHRLLSILISTTAIGAGSLSLAACSNGTAASAASITLRAEHVHGVGPVLAGNSGRTLYYLTVESSSSILCTGSCNMKWFPDIVTSGTSTIESAGVRGSVSTAVRPDGSQQLTFNGHPAYFYFRDKASGEAKGQGNDGTWFALKPAPTGVTIRSSTTSTTTTTGPPAGNPYGY